MNKRQRENVSKYLYDISKGIVFLVIIGDFIKDQFNLPNLFFGFLAAITFFIWAHIIDEGFNND